jgi:hypothetical protein
MVTDASKLVNSELAVLKSQSLHEAVRLAPWPRPEQR